jgi:hypothetical protein
VQVAGEVFLVPPKITQLVAQHKHRESPVFLGIPAIDRIAGRTG